MGGGGRGGGVGVTHSTLIIPRIYLSTYLPIYLSTVHAPVDRDFPYRQCFVKGRPANNDLSARELDSIATTRYQGWVFGSWTPSPFRISSSAQAIVGFDPPFHLSIIAHHMPWSRSCWSGLSFCPPLAPWSLAVQSVVLLSLNAPVPSSLFGRTLLFAVSRLLSCSESLFRPPARYPTTSTEERLVIHVPSFAMMSYVSFFGRQCVMLLSRDCLPRGKRVGTLYEMGDDELREDNDVVGVAFGGT